MPDQAGQELVGWLFLAFFALALAGLGVGLRLRRRQKKGDWGLPDAIAVLLSWVWASTGLSLFAIRVASGSFFPESTPLAPAVGATAAAGLLTGVVILRFADWDALGLRRLALRWCGGGLLVLPFLLGASALWVQLLLLLGVQPEAQEIAGLFAGDSPVPTRLALGLYAVLLAPLVEELLVRGFLLRPLAKRLGDVGGILASALLFGALHLADPQAVPPLILLGIVLAWLRLRSGSLWPSITLHVANNGLALGSILLLPASGTA